MSEWQPIESAPKDGTLVLVLFDDGDVVEARNHGDGTDEHNDWWSVDGLDFDYGEETPVAWKPLPVA